jgi:hypothetical protein
MTGTLFFGISFWVGRQAVLNFKPARNRPARHVIYEE